MHIPVAWYMIHVLFFSASETPENDFIPYLHRVIPTIRCSLWQLIKACEKDNRIFYHVSKAICIERESTIA